MQNCQRSTDRIDYRSTRIIGGGASKSLPQPQEFSDFLKDFSNPEFRLNGRISAIKDDQMSLRILLDMDELIVDFISGACWAHGVDPVDMERHRIPGEWSIVVALGRALGRFVTPFTLDEFWLRINDGSPAFWEMLHPTPFADGIVALVEQATDDWYIVTAPSHSPQSYSGKVKWLKTYFGDDFDRFVITPHKHLFAADNTVLIDDRETNCNSFSERGGLAILFPHRGNSLHAYADDPLSVVKHQLDKLL